MPPPGPTGRGLCAAAEPSVSYQELKDLKKANVLHIDVRERWEIDRFGKIPESINIPRKLSRPPVVRRPRVFPAPPGWNGQAVVTEQRGTRGAGKLLACNKAELFLQRN